MKTSENVSSPAPIDTKEREHIIYRVTIVGSIVNLLLVAFKFVAGVLGRSSAMVADAVHSLSDLISDIVVLVFVRLASRPRDDDHNYGHGKYETLASIAVGVMLLVVSIMIMYNGVRDVWDIVVHHASRPLPTSLALWAAIISILLKEGLYHYTVIRGRRIQSAALEANAWHHRSDALTSIATLIGIGGAMLLGPKWSLLDPLAAAVVSIFIIKASIDILRPGIDELLEKSLPPDTIQSITDTVLTTPGVLDLHKLCTRRVGTHPAVEMHLQMSPDITLLRAHDIASDVELRLRTLLGPDAHIGIHMEPLLNI